MGHRRIGRTFVAHEKAQERRASALELVRVIALMQIDEMIKRKMLNNCLWYLTETEGTSKYRTSFMSRSALGKSPKLLHHDHVLPRRELVREMMSHSERAVEIAAKAIGCTVTRKEHAILTAQDKHEPGLEGWERYRRAGIEVIDTTTGETIS